MGKLLQRLQDASRSGVYRVRREAEVLDALRGSALGLARLPLNDVANQESLFATLGDALDFPDWFGHNWDALQDCLKDLSWRDAQVHVLLFSHDEKIPQADLGTLFEVLGAAAEFWRH